MPRAAKTLTPWMQWLLLCAAVEIDQDGNVSFRHVFDGITVSGFPVQLRFTISVQFRGGTGTHRFWLRMTAPDGEVKEGQENQFWLSSTVAAHRIDTRSGWGITAPGKYFIEAMLDGRSVGKLPLTVQGDGAAHVAESAD